MGTHGRLVERIWVHNLLWTIKLNHLSITQSSQTNTQSLLLLQFEAELVKGEGGKMTILSNCVNFQQKIPSY